MKEKPEEEKFKIEIAAKEQEELFKKLDKDVADMVIFDEKFYGDK